ncbi:MAG: hypothetical protein IKB42_04805 [Clostridia bacterium]|nr:hypothetical protein [Clostridia bacterium]
MSVKDMKSIKDNAARYDAVRKQKIEAAKAAGVDFGRLSVPDDFEFGQFGEDYFKQRCPQQLPIPITDKQAKVLMDMKKKMIGIPYVTKNKGKIIQGAYFVSDTDPRYFFAVSIVTPEDGNDKFFDYNVKLDVCLSGKQWLPLARFDSFGPGHPNYTKDGQVVEPNKVVNQRTPHLHLYDEFTQVVCDDIEYTPAHDVDRRLFTQKESNDPQYFKSGIKSFFGMLNIQPTYNKVVENNYHFTHQQPLFSWENIDYSRTPREMREGK